MNRKINEGMMYALLGVVFLVITLDLIFPIIMVMMRVLFIIIGGLSIIGGIKQIINAFKKKKI